MKSALILIDIQNDYFRNGKNELKNCEQALQHAVEVLKIFRENGGMICHVRHINLSLDAAFFAKDSKGSEIHQEVFPIGGEEVFIKHSPNSFCETKLHETLQSHGVTNLIICGMMSHMCIDTSVRAARDLGYRTTVISDACATKDLIWDGQTIEAEIVHGVIMASLSNTFAMVVSKSDYISGILHEINRGM